MPCGFGYGTVCGFGPPPPIPVLPPKPKSKPAPKCSIELWRRPVPLTKGPANHTYIYVQDSDWALTDPQGLMLEGGPSNGFASWLIGVNNPPGQGLGKGKPTASDPSLPSNHEIGPAYTGPNACLDIAEMLAAMAVYDSSGHLAPYSAFAGVLGYNSNSFTHTLLNDVGLVGFFGNPTGWTPGWSQLVPGL